MKLENIIVAVGFAVVMKALSKVFVSANYGDIFSALVLIFFYIFMRDILSTNFHKKTEEGGIE